VPDAALTAAIKEAYASAPASEVIYHTLELRHPSFTQPLRVVRDIRPITARLEASAPINPLAWVEFQPYAFDFSLPEVSTTGLPEITITIDNVSTEIVAYMDAAANSADMIEVTYRPYLASDLSAPQMDPPLTLTIREASADVFRITARAAYVDLSSRSFPRELYTSERFPGLVA
jgi:hypothetical protein